MPNRRPLVILCAALVVVFLVLAVVYFTKTAGDLPSILPGHQAGSTRHHTKHGIAMLGLAVLSGIGAWMFSGPAGDRVR